jgi:hypothetical protein
VTVARSTLFDYSSPKLDSLVWYVHRVEEGVANVGRGRVVGRSTSTVFEDGEFKTRDLVVVRVIRNGAPVDIHVDADATAAESWMIQSLVEQVTGEDAVVGSLTERDPHPDLAPVSSDVGSDADTPF